MKNLFDCKEEKVTEKAFSQSLLISALSILLCLVALCSMTFAWFTGGATSDNNTIRSGNFGLNVAVLNSENSPVEISKRANGASDCYLQPGIYTVTMAMTADTTVSKGFCVIEASGKDYKTESINNEDTNSFTFKIEVKSEALSVTFVPEWGLSAETDVVFNGTLVIENLQGSGE